MRRAYVAGPAPFERRYPPVTGTLATTIKTIASVAAVTVASAETRDFVRSKQNAAGRFAVEPPGGVRAS
jgi:hypothetical protein